MIKKLLDVLSEHKDYLETLQDKMLYVADWKDENNGVIIFPPSICKSRAVDG